MVVDFTALPEGIDVVIDGLLFWLRLILIVTVLAVGGDSGAGSCSGASGGVGSLDGALVV